MHVLYVGAHMSDGSCETTFAEAWRVCRNDTMVSERYAQQAYNAVRNVARSKVAGDILEAGVWRNAIHTAQTPDQLVASAPSLEPASVDRRRDFMPHGMRVARGGTLVAAGFQAAVLASRHLVIVHELRTLDRTLDVALLLLLPPLGCRLCALTSPMPRVLK